MKIIHLKQKVLIICHQFGMFMFFRYFAFGDLIHQVIPNTLGKLMSSSNYTKMTKKDPGVLIAWFLIPMTRVFITRVILDINVTS